MIFPGLAHAVQRIIRPFIAGPVATIIRGP